MTFSLPGLILSVVILAPSLLLLFFRPTGMPEWVPDAGPVFTTLERVGQAGCLVAPALTATRAELDPWLLVIGILVAGYYLLWGRYLAGGRRFSALYAPLGPLPVPMAVLPVGAFLVSAGWLWSVWVLAAAVVLGVGHIVNSWIVARSVE